MALPYLAVPSCEAVAQRRPSTVVQTCTTQPVCPSSTCAQLPLTTSHTRAVKSSEAVKTRRPSGVSATDHTAPATRDPAARATHVLGIQPRPKKLNKTENKSSAALTLAFEYRCTRHTHLDKRKEQLGKTKHRILIVAGHDRTAMLIMRDMLESHRQAFDRQACHIPAPAAPAPWPLRT